MPEFSKKFFLNLDLDSSDHEDNTEIKQVFQNEVYVLSRDHCNTIKKLQEQMKMLEKMDK